MKRLQHILIPNGKDETFEAIELTSTRLAIYREYNALWRRDEYYLVHIASDSRLLSEFVCSFVYACQWLRAIKDFIDWTQPESSFKERYDLEMKVRLARLDC